MARGRSLEALAKADHVKGCHNEPPWPYLAISHRDVHDSNARRVKARLPKASEEKPDGDVS